jgi:FkbM family methyltransferase
MIINTKPVYSLLETITFGQGLHKTVNGVRIKLPAKYIRYFQSDYEKENFDFLKSCCGEGATILDIGAHIGLFSTIAAKITGVHGKIFAFEPSPATIPVLHQTIRINELDNLITPVNQAMGKEVGKMTFFVSDNEADNSNSLVSYKEDRKLNAIETEVNTIDNFVMTKKLSKVNFIKIDAEGAEYDVIRGGAAVFKKYRPNIILAIHPEPIAKKGDRMEDIYDFMEQLRYNILYKGEYISKEKFCSITEMFDLNLIPA